MNISDALTELGSQIGLSDLALNDAGLCRVLFDDSLTVDFESMDEGRTLHVSSVVLPFAPELQGEEFLKQLLQANLLGIATGGAHFSASELEGEILFERSLDIQSMDFTGFTQAIESFVNHLEGWREKLASGSSSAAVSNDASFSFHIRA